MLVKKKKPLLFTSTETKISFWQNLRPCQHDKLSKCRYLENIKVKIPVQPIIQIWSKLPHFSFIESKISEPYSHAIAWHIPVLFSYTRSRKTLCVISKSTTSTKGRVKSSSPVSGRVVCDDTSRLMLATNCSFICGSILERSRINAL